MKLETLFEMRTKIESTEKEISLLEKDMRDYELESEHIEADIAKIESERLSLEQLKESNGKLISAKKDIKTARLKVADLTTRLAHQFSEITKIKNQLEDERSDIATTNKLRDRTEKLGILQEDLKEEEEKVQSLSARIEELKIFVQEIPQAQSKLQEAELRMSDLINRREKIKTLLKVKTRLKSFREKLALQLAEYQKQLDSLIGSVDTSVPLALLPVKLETRFAASMVPTGGNALLIRIYPDDIHKDTHEPELTENEVEWAKHFWDGYLTAGITKDEKLQAWRQIVERFGSRRAIWIAQQMVPVGGAYPTPKKHKAVWTRAPLARAMPDRWVALGYLHNKKIFTVWGDLVSPDLATGPSPSAEIPTGNVMDDGMKWMVDFNEAVRKGMGIRVHLSPDQTQGPLSLIVLGLKATMNPDESILELKDLVEAHQHTWGFEFVPQGTPTNNTDLIRSGYTRNYGYDTSFELEWDGSSSVPEDGSDGDLAAKAFGFSKPQPGEPYIFEHVRHAGNNAGKQATGQDQADARYFNTIVWPCTLNYFLRQMLYNNLKDLDLSLFRRHFIENVRARGPLPTFRVGNQPYGILPVTSINLWKPEEYQPELIVFTINRSHKVGIINIAWDLKDNGTIEDWTKPVTIPAHEEIGTSTIGGSFAVTDIDKSGRYDMITLRIESDENNREHTSLRIGRNVNQSGLVENWSNPVLVPNWEGDSNICSSIAIREKPLNNGRPDLFVLRVDFHDNEKYAYAMIGHDLAPDGNVNRWSGPIKIAENLSTVKGAGLAVADIDNNGLEDIVFLYILTSDYGNIGYITIGRNIDETGNVNGGWTPPLLLNEITSDLSAGAVSDVDISFIKTSDGHYDLILFYVIEIDHQKTGYVKRASNLKTDGTVEKWTNVSTSLPMNSNTSGAGIAIADIGRGTSVDFVNGGTLSLVNMVDRLRNIWRNALLKIPFAGKGDPDNDLISMLTMEPFSKTFSCRRLLGSDYTKSIWWLMNQPLTEPWWATHDELARKFLKDLHIWDNKDPRMVQASFANESFSFDGALVQEGELSENEPLKPNYIEWLYKTPPKVIHDNAFSDTNSRKTLLYKILRHSLLLSYTDAAFLTEPPTDPILAQDGLIREPELVDLADITSSDPIKPAHTLTSWRYLTEAKHFGLTLDKYLYGLTVFNTPNVLELGEFLTSLKAISERPTAVLERLLGETLDLTSHRLDAWITSIATERLYSLRSKTPEGIQLGGFGFVENLVPASTGIGSEGFIHAPSLGQATTAAILRSGYLSHNDTLKGKSLAVDLSSTRVRRALWLMEGIRQGQPIAALLGYIFERYLHEIKLDRFIPVFRQIAPLVAGKLIQTNESLENIAANNVADGLALLRRWQEGKNSGPENWSDTTIPFGGSNLPSSGIEYDSLHDALSNLEDITDSISDIMMAESVYQATQGNYLRSGASLDAVSRGEVPPSDPEIVKTPRSGKGITHRILVMFDGNFDPYDESLAKWSADTSIVKKQVRAAAEPSLNAWISMLLGDPARVICSVDYLEPGTQDITSLPLHTIQLSLKDLMLSPLDVLYSTEVQEVAQKTELEDRIAYRALKMRPPDVPSNAGIRINFHRNEEWTSDILSFPELLEIARAARDAVAGSRPVKPSDISLPGDQDSTIQFDLIELKNRVSTAVESMKNAYEDLRKFFGVTSDDVEIMMSFGNLPKEVIEGLTNLLDIPKTYDIDHESSQLDIPKLGDLNHIRDTLVLFSYFGLPNSMPQSISGSTPEDRNSLLKQSLMLAQDVEHRLERIDNTLDDPLSQMAELFGTGFRILPKFKLSTTELQKALDLRETINDVSPEKLITWFHRIAHVRDGAKRLQTLLMYSEAAGCSDTTGFRIAQLPKDLPDKDRWVGLSDNTGDSIAGGRTSLAIHTPGNSHFNPISPVTNSPIPISGLLVDDWIEVVPNPQETTGLTFQYDAPGAQAPQAILLAIPPDINSPWNLDILASILLETIELLKIRTVDQDALEGAGHFLPGSYFAFNSGGDPEGDTVSTDFH